jgi:hypothetical protein
MRAELSDISGKFADLTSKQLPSINKALSGAGARALEVPPQSAFDDTAPGRGGGGRTGSPQDPDADDSLALPADLRLWN